MRTHCLCWHVGMELCAKGNSCHVLKVFARVLGLDDFSTKRRGTHHFIHLEFITLHRHHSRSLVGLFPVENTLVDDFDLVVFLVKNINCP